MKFTFKDRDLYPNHIFKIDHFHAGDPTKTRIWLKCITDESVQINRYCHINELEIIG